MNGTGGGMAARPVASIVLVMLGLLAPRVQAQWLNHPTPGLPRSPDGKPNLTAPAPRTAEGRPDLSGIWAAECAIYGRDSCFTKSLFFNLAKDLKPEDTQMTPWAAQIPPATRSALPAPRSRRRRRGSGRSGIWSTKQECDRPARRAPA